MLDAAVARSLAIRELAALTDTACQLGAEDWGLPTRCVGWTVADVCSHAGLAAVQQAEAFRRAVKGVHEPPDYPGAPVLSPVETLELLNEGVHALDAALADLTAEALGGLTPMPFGIVPTVVAVQVPVYEYAFHRGDVRDATGMDAPVPADIASAFMGFLPGLATMLAGGAKPGQPAHAYRLVAPSGTVTLEHGDGGWEVVADATAPLCNLAGADDAIALFAMGRISAGDPRLTVTGPAAMAGTEFKRWFPGP